MRSSWRPRDLMEEFRYGDSEYSCNSSKREPPPRNARRSKSFTSTDSGRSKCFRLSETDAEKLIEINVKATRCLEILAQQSVQHQRDTGGTVMDFLELNPPLFVGEDKSADLVDRADSWLAEVEKIFGVLDCPEEKKADYAALRLSGAAQVWWDNILYTSNNKQSYSWEDFKRLFRKHYISTAALKKKTTEFQLLRQGTDNVIDYACKFRKLERYVRRMEEGERMDKFIEGLSDSLRMHLVMMKPMYPSFDLLLDMTLTAEANLPVRAVSTSPFVHKGTNFKKKGSFRNQGPQQREKCKNYEKFHPGRCMKPTTCYHCHKEGHIRTRCPLLLGAGAGSGTGAGTGTDKKREHVGRVFTIDVVEAETNNDVIGGNFTMKRDGTWTQGQEAYSISSDDSDSEEEKKKLKVKEAFFIPSRYDVSESGALLRRAEMYQEFMKRMPIPMQRESVIPCTSWQGLGKSMKKLYHQPFHYLTNINLKQWDEQRAGAEDESQRLDVIIHPSKAEARIWVTEEVHRLTTSHHYLAKLWTADSMYHSCIDPVIPQNTTILS